MIHLATIYGTSGCTAELLHGLHRKGLRDIQSFPTLIRFQREYLQPLPALKERESQCLRGEIADLLEQEKRHAHLLGLKAAEREASLVKEREGIPAQVQARSGTTPNPFKALWRLLARVHLRRRLHVLTEHLPQEVARPFKWDRWKIAEFQKKQVYLGTHFDAIMAKRLRAGLRAKQYLDAHRQLVVGASGEEAVIRELGKLPAPFVVINDVHLSLNRSVYWRQGHEYIRSSQVDHVVVGPGGVFLLETKNWRQSRATSAGGWTPEHQIGRAGLIFYILASHRFWHQVPTRQLVVMIQECPIVRQEFVTRLPLSALVTHLLRAPPCLTGDQIQKVSKWLI